MTVNRQRFSSVVGLIIVAFHIGLTAYLWLVFQPEADSAVAAAQIATPLTVTYAVSIVAWFVSTRGLITSNEQIGIAFVILTVMVVVSFLGALPLGPYLYHEHRLTPDQLNQYYTFVEASLGGMFVLIFNFMFGATHELPNPNAGGH